MDTLEYGKRAATKYLHAYAAQNGKRYTVGCNLTFAENMLGKFANAARLEKMNVPAYGNTGNHLLDVLIFAGHVLAIDPNFRDVELFGAGLGLSWEPQPTQ